MVQRDETAYYVFEDGHELPLLRFCCGEALTVFDLDKSRQNMRGRRLKAMAMGSVELTDGRELPQFRLVFSKKGLLSSELIEPLSPEVAVQMRHPDNCLHKPRLSPTDKRRTYLDQLSPILTTSLVNATCCARTIKFWTEQKSPGLNNKVLD